MPGNGRLAADRLLSWFKLVRQPWPWRLLFKATGSPYPIWISEIMLQQTSIKAALPVYDRFMKTYPNLYSLAETDESTLRKAVRGLGYYRRFAHLLKAAQTLTKASAQSSRSQSGGDQSGGDIGQQVKAIKWPTTYEGWKTLPGVGAYTAAAISSIVFKVKVGVVDGNVERVLCRLFDLQMPTGGTLLKARFQSFMNEWIDTEEPGLFNEAIMELGQTICTKNTPDCTECPLNIICLAYSRGTQHLSPGRKDPQSYRDVAVILHIVQAEEDGRFGLFKRPSSALFLKGVPGFFTVVTTPNHVVNPTTATYLGDFKHSITKYRLRTTVLLHKRHLCVDCKQIDKDQSLESSPMDTIKWLHHDEVDENLTANFDRKAWHLYLDYLDNIQTKKKTRLASNRVSLQTSL